MKKILPRVLFFIFFLSFSSVSVSAVTVTINNPPSEITLEPFTVSASISGAASGTNYLRIDLFKENTTNYFGETYNGSDWYQGSDGTQYLPITIQKGVIWTGEVKGRFGLPSSNQYNWTGNYKLKIRRYTASGSSASDDCNVIAINLNIPTPTFTPTPTSVPTTQPTSTPIPTVVPTNTLIPSPMPSPSQKPTLKPTIRITPTVNKDKTEYSSSSSKLISPTKTQGVVKGVKTEAGFGRDLPKILIIIGILSILAMIITSFVIPKISK